MALDIHYPFLCPYCHQRNLLWIDITGGSHQQLIVDCEVCCSPIVADIILNDKLQIDHINVRPE